MRSEALTPERFGKRIASPSRTHAIYTPAPSLEWRYVVRGLLRALPSLIVCAAFFGLIAFGVSHFITER